MNTDTPRTDTLYAKLWCQANENEATEALAQLRDFARELERECNQQRQTIANIRASLDLAVHVVG